MEITTIEHRLRDNFIEQKVFFLKDEEELMFLIIYFLFRITTLELARVTASIRLEITTIQDRLRDNFIERNLKKKKCRRTYVLNNQFFV